MPWRLETAHPKLPGKVWSGGVMCDEAGACRARVWGALLSQTKGPILAAEGRRKPLKSLEQGSRMVRVLEGLLWLECGNWIGCAGKRITWTP